MAYLVAGPFVALVGIVAVFFVLRRKSVEKRSMYSARREQIEHKVRAARQRTLAPHGRPKPADTSGAGAPADPFAQPQATVTYQAPTYQAPAYQAPTTPAPSPPPPAQPSYDTPAPSAWDAAAASPPAAPPSFDYPPAPPEPAYAAAPADAFAPAPEQAAVPSETAWTPAAEPTPMPPSEPAWTPAPEPQGPAEHVDTAPAAPATPASGAAGWSIVTTEKDSSATEEPARAGKSGTSGSWQLASGEAPGVEADEGPAKTSSNTAMAMAQYAVLVVGLVMVLIGVLVMVANSHTG
jgi:hypothetical protein